MKCPKCGKLLKEGTDGDDRFCQGHSLLEGINTTAKVESAVIRFCNRCDRRTYHKRVSDNAWVCEVCSVNL